MGADAFELFGELRGDASHFQRAMRQADSELKRFDKSVEESNRRRISFEQKWALQAQRLEAQTARMRERLAQQSSQFQIRMAQQAANRFEAEQRRMQAAAERAAAKAQQAWASFGQGMRNVGTALTVGLTAPIVLASKSILTAGIDYEKALNIFQAVTKASAGEMSRASEIARQLGADVSLPATSAKDAALAMSELGKAGLTAAQAMDAAKGVLQLAAAGTLDEARAAEIAANALNSFKLQASDTARVADLLAAASNSSSAEVSDIAESMQQASAVFAGARVPIEDLTTAIGLMANAGIKGSDAGTSLKTFLQRLTAPTDNAAEAMQGLGVKIFDAQGKMKALPDIIGQFEKSLAGLNDEAKAEKLATIFGADAIRAAQILFKEGSAGFDKMKGAVTQLGAASDLAAAKTKGLGGAWESLKSQLETIGISIFEAVDTPLSQLLQSGAKNVEQFGKFFSELSQPVQQAAVAFAALAAAAGPVLIVVGSLVSAISTLVGAIGGLAGLGTVALVIAGIGTAIAPVVAWATVLYEAWKTNFGGVQELTSQVATKIKEVWDAALAHISQLTNEVTAEISAFWQENGADIMKAVQTVSNAIKTFWQTNLAAINALWKQHGDEIKAIASAAWNIVRDVVMSAVRQVLNAVKLVAAIINGDWAKAWDAAQSIAKAATNAIASVLVNGEKIIRNILLGLVKFLFTLSTQLFAAGLEMGKNIVQGVITGVQSKMGEAKAVMNSLAAQLAATFAMKLLIQSPSQVFFGFGKDTVQGYIDGINSLKASAQSAMASLLDVSGLKIKLGKGDKEGVELLTQLTRELAGLNVETKEQEVRQTLTAKAYEKLNAQVKERIILAAQELDKQNATKEALSKFNDVLKDISGIKETSFDKLKQFFGDANLTAEIERMAKAAGNTVAQFKALANLRALVFDEKDKPLVPPVFERGEITKDGIGELPTDELYEAAPRIKAVWEDFFATFRDRLAQIKAEMPTFKAVLGDSFIGAIDAISSTFANAATSWITTGESFFSSIAKGFAQMAQQIISELIRIAMVKLITQALGSIFGGGGSSVGSLGVPGGATGGLVGGSIAPARMATGGMIRGAGTGTSDSIAAWLSNGEFVNRAKSVAFYGRDFFEKLNNLQIPRMALAGGGGYGYMPSTSSHSTIDKSQFHQPVTIYVQGGNEQQNIASARQIKRELMRAQQAEYRRNK